MTDAKNLLGFHFVPLEVDSGVGHIDDVREQYRSRLFDALASWDGPAPWGLLCMKPNCDEFLIDMASSDWFERMLKLNMRHVRGLLVPRRISVGSPRQAPA